tara:strand:- start:395 stop:604 length:210 start_codon:yes stop_codon:yes gene_type:complete
LTQILKISEFLIIFLEESSLEIASKFIPGLIITLVKFELSYLSKMSNEKKLRRITIKKKTVVLGTTIFS